MQVVVRKDSQDYFMGYDPCHRQALIEYYKELLREGEIESCLIDGESI